MMSKVMWRVLLDRVATGIRTPKQIEGYIANSPYWYVRYAVVHDLRVTHDTLVQLSRDPIMRVRHAAELRMRHAAELELLIRAKHAGG